MTIEFPQSDNNSDDDWPIQQEVDEWIGVCNYNNRTPQENFELLCRDNPWPEERKRFEQVLKLVQEHFERLGKAE